MAGHSVSGTAVSAFWLRRYGSPLRWPVMIMLLVSALAHIPVVAPELRETPYVAALFLLLILADLVLIAALFLRDSAAAWTLTALTTGLAALAYVLSRTVGLPALYNYIGDWVSVPGLVSLASEAIGCVLAVFVLIRHPATAAIPAAEPRSAGTS
ncbi:hypothetical protein [Sciscionella marina]|uniref:hypothetical protein n=1 Tax=Sciscionella marina TaxID=508770 RepID=UPI000377CC3D|nr:hypothetical protein [Sciscionella marina]